MNLDLSLMEIFHCTSMYLSKIYLRSVETHKCNTLYMHLLLEISWITNRNLKHSMSKTKLTAKHPLPDATATETKHNKISWKVFLISINGTTVCPWNPWPKPRGQPRFFTFYPSPSLNISIYLFFSVNSSQSHPISPLEYDKTAQPYLSAPLHVNPSLSDLFSQ